MNSVSILAIGSELLDGRVVNSNAQYLSGELEERGIRTQEVLTCNDSFDAISRGLRFLFDRTDFVIVSGGLGPTTDDLTREAVSEFLGLELVRNDSVLESLRKRYEERGRFFDPSNAKQALFPEHSTLIPNPVGTALGFISKRSEKALACLPGVPRELKAMFQETILPLLSVEDVSQQTVLLRVMALPESVVGSKVSALGLRSELKVSYRVLFPEVQVKLRCPAEEASDIRKAVSAALGPENIFSDSLSTDFPEVLRRILAEGNATVSVAESCTGGMLGALLTEPSGASAIFPGGVITYSNELKASLLGVSMDLIENQGAVSYAVAREMAEAIRRRTQSSIGLSISGIAGPEGGSPVKPVGTFFVGLSTERESISYKFFFPSSRDLIRKYAGYKALDVVRRSVLGLPVPVDAVCE